MRVYRRYLMREVAAAILLVLAGFLALFGFFDMVGEIRNVGDGGYQFHHALMFVILRLPGRIYELMPVAVLIGALYSLSALARHSEITVFRASGMSTGRLLAVLCQVALLFGALAFVIGEVVVPPSERAAQSLRLRERGRTVGQDLRSGLWAKDEGSFINARTVLPDSRLQGIRIYTFDEKLRLQSITEAKQGQFRMPDGWLLTDVTQTTLHDERSETLKLPEMNWKSALNPDLLSVLMIAPERMSVMHLMTYVRHLAENNQQTQRYEIALWKKLIYPLAALVMVALALPFGYTHNRLSNVSLKILAGVMIGVFFHMLNGLFSSLGAINSWSPALSAVAPSALFMLAAAAMIWWVERR